MNVYDFFLGGSETTSSTLRWFFLYMARYQEIQKKVQKEIDENIPTGQQISLQDKDRLPYLEALSFEINRKVSLLPTSFPHEVTKNTLFQGYKIPKGTWIVANAESCHRNPKYWKHPNKFSLENFLDEDGKVIRNKEGYLPFSLGIAFEKGVECALDVDLTLNELEYCAEPPNDLPKAEDVNLE
ncbi:Cytochrome P450 2L1 [Armadillidium nasatum]|uniref:Cytochrome P450 2L1 n=1 Tax=Armadillidium nasatum TaxID=96803 RepID=A0A5N5T3K5_9CRUS|nr:Cytochrome P450 2L1 [Armadillidium nasatum]